ncbi:hypothetical protein CC80DRAFT_392256, partial [Byssothecium circinans]
TLEGHTSRVSSVAFSAAGDRLAAASGDETVRMWDAKTGQPLHTLELGSQVQNLAFSSDGFYLETDRGLMLLPPPVHSTSTLWRTADAEKMLWIPADYQPSCSAAYSYSIAFGYSSGRVLLL